MLQSFVLAVIQLDLNITVIINCFYFSKEERRQVVLNQMNTFLSSLLLTNITSERTHLITTVLPLELDVNGHGYALRTVRSKRMKKEIQIPSL